MFFTNDERRRIAKNLRDEAPATAGCDFESIWAKHLDEILNLPDDCSWEQVFGLLADLIEPDSKDEIEKGVTND